ncbi:tRNA wybutosine-synthesizing protein 5-like [Hydractinia symbiolongicarpus]|uniref:tRNA wybutosine-synthesizing protein 5-like n=1 Tax=Hydractinia symbiolongicarpus TaxID=13093 RepID=UPI00254C305A|nr:tRNA wybutosine-synthesizing protein 5-like [Hydractinia symbiolongicarpus]
MYQDIESKVHSVEVYNESSNPNGSYFKDVLYPRRIPVVLKGFNIGDMTTWTAEYLTRTIGETPVKVHVCPESRMDFLKKNFLYKTLPFNQFIKRVIKEKQHEYFISPLEKYYLRSLGSDARKDVSDISKQFPDLSKNLIIPELFDKDKFFSSVFRISSSNIQLWTHYDVMDNILIHLTGQKKVVLFPPNELLNLYMNGDKSEIIDIDKADLTKYPRYKNVKRYECILQPGDILFIPALWFHNVRSLDFSVSVNVFWKHLDNLSYDIKDVYGNKDPVVAQRALQGVDKALKLLETLPEEYKDFYKMRLISKIENKP